MPHLHSLYLDAFVSRQGLLTASDNDLRYITTFASSRGHWPCIELTRWRPRQAAYWQRRYSLSGACTAAIHGHAGLVDEMPYASRYHNCLYAVALLKRACDAVRFER